MPEPGHIHPPHIKPPKPANLPEPRPPHPNYRYDANEAAAIIFCVIFGLCFLAHLVQAIRYRTLWVWALLVGLALETEGFAMRWLSIEELYTSWPSIVHQVSVIIAPAFITAQNYMMVGRMISYLGKEWSPISHSLITVVFVLADVISIITQGISALMLDGPDFNTTKVAFRILIAALIFQVVMFSIFVVITVVFDRRTREALGEKRKPIQPLFVAFYISASMVILRSIYRALEFATIDLKPTGATGYSLTHEWLIYVWDALPITVAAIVLAVLHAGRYLPRKKGLRIDGTVEEPGRTCFCCGKRRRNSKHVYGDKIAMLQQGSRERLNEEA